MKIRRKITIACLLASLVMLTGCVGANRIPELSEEEEALVVEYAASTLLKYDTKYAEKLTEIPAEEPAEEVPPMTEGDMIKASDNAADMPQSPEAANVATEQPTQEPEVSVESILGLQDVEVTYKEYEVDDFYPNNGNDIYFVMNATDGCQLLVLKFELKNLSEQEQEVSVMPGTVRMKIVLNGSEKNALTTMLLNDLATYQGTLAPQESTELVVVGEYKAEELQNIDSLELKLKSDSAETILNCK